jgi:hypothetical protein
VSAGAAAGAAALAAGAAGAVALAADAPSGAQQVASSPSGASSPLLLFPSSGCDDEGTEA